MTGEIIKFISQFPVLLVNKPKFVYRETLELLTVKCLASSLLQKNTYIKNNNNNNKINKIFKMNISYRIKIAWEAHANCEPLSRIPEHDLSLLVLLR